MLGECLPLYYTGFELTFIVVYPAVISISNLLIYVGLPSQRQGLDAALVPMLSSSMAIIGSRIVLNFKGAYKDSSKGHTDSDSVPWTDASTPMQDQYMESFVTNPVFLEGAPRLPSTLISAWESEITSADHDFAEVPTPV